jgi:hypothetical protein
LVSSSEQERIHDCVREIRKLWNKTARICVRNRICELDNVNWDVQLLPRVFYLTDMESAWRLEHRVFLPAEEKIFLAFVEVF